MLTEIYLSDILNDYKGLSLVKVIYGGIIINHIRNYMILGSYKMLRTLLFMLEYISRAKRESNLSQS